MSLCENCTHHIGNNTCMVPIKNGEFYTWSTSTDVLNDDGSCVHYDAITFLDKVTGVITKPYYTILRHVESISDFVRYSIVGRIKYGFDIRDTWNLGDSVAGYMKPRLRYYIDSEPMGVPGSLVSKDYVLDNDLAQYFDGELKDEWFDADSDVNEVMKAWVAILEAMYFSLEYMTDKWDDKFSTSYTDIHGKFTVNREKTKLLDDKVVEGNRLLGLFLQNIWD